MRAFLLTALVVAALAGAETGPDDETVQRAEAILAELAAQQPAPPDDAQLAEAFDHLSQAELAAVEAKAWLDAGKHDEAGASFLLARQHLADIPAELRSSLEPRVGQLDRSLLTLARRFLDSEWLPDEMDADDGAQAPAGQGDAEPAE